MKSSVLFRLIKEFKKKSIIIIFGLIIGLFSVFLTLYLQILVGDAIDNIVDFNNVNFDNINMIIKLLIIISLLSIVTSLIVDIIIQEISYQVINNLRIKLFNKLQNVSIMYLDSVPQGKILSTISIDIDQISNGVIQGLKQLLTGLFTIIFTLIIMFNLAYEIALVVLFLTPLSLIASTIIAKKSYKIFKEQAQTRSKLLSYGNEMMLNHKLIQNFNYENESIDDFQVINNTLDKIGFKAQMMSALINPITRFVNALIYASVGIFAAILIINNPSYISVGTLYVFLSYSTSYTKPFNEISNVFAELQNSLASAKRVFDLLDEKEEKKFVDSKSLILDGNIEFKNVCFSYDNNDFIKNLNLKINKNEKVAIVGETGSGKTTLINLILKFYAINSGNIYYDNIKDIDLGVNVIRDNIGLVLQDSWIFKGSIKENISYGVLNKTDEEIINASKMAYAHDFIMKLPNGYDTIINDDINLSIGEKQLLSIAQIILKNPNILVLDEATSSIDTRTEVLVSKSINNLIKNKTSIIIAHRLKTIIDADVILVMQNGSIIESGKHSELLNKGGYYSNLYNKQFLNN